MPLLLFMPLLACAPRLDAEIGVRGLFHLGPSCSWLVGSSFHGSMALILLTGAGVIALALPDAARSERTVSLPEALRGRRVVLFDGVCNLCNGYVSFLLHRSDDTLMFAALQSEEGAAVRSQLGSNPDTVPDSILLVDTDERVYVRSDAVLKVVSSLGGLYRATSALWVIPRVLRDAVYRVVARWRYPVFGRRDLCRVPTTGERDRFL